MYKEKKSGLVTFLKVLLLLIFVCGVAYGGFVYGQLTLRENLVEVDFPIKQNFEFDLKQNVSIPVNAQVLFPFKDSFIVNEIVPIDIVVPIDEIINVPIDLPTGRVVVDVPIRKNISISSSVNFSKTINFSKDIALNVTKDIPFFIEKTISIPLDTIIRANIPVPYWMKK